MVWDGLSFFGMDHMKLGRLNGEQVNFCTFFKSPETVAVTLILISVSAVVFLGELNKLYE